MTPDELMDRLRAADPAAGLDPAPPERALVTAFRRRLARRRVARVSVGGALVALCATVATAVAPSGGGTVGPPGEQSVPGVARVIAQAAQASEQPAGTILRLTSEAEVRGTLREVRTTWVRIGEDGRRLGMRTLRLEADGEQMPDGLDHTWSVEDGQNVTREYLPGRGVRTERGAQTIPSIVTRAHELLRRGQTGDRDITLAGEEDVGGRRGYRLIVTRVYAEEEGGDPLDGDRTELVVDTETFRPLLLRIHNEGTDVRGRWFTYDFSEHVRTWTTLPDTPENRLQLELRGPTG